jgi:hypothetical protein
MWIGTDVKGCCHDEIEGAMWIGNDVKGIFTTNLSIIFIATVLKGC